MVSLSGIIESSYPTRYSGVTSLPGEREADYHGIVRRMPPKFR
jgi:hypothetical protein